MKKLRLNLDEVKIESFEVQGIPLSRRGTVRGRQECEGEEQGEAFGGFGLPEDEAAGGCSCKCCACSCACCCKCKG